MSESRSAIADPARGPEVSRLLRTALEGAVEAIRAEDVSGVPFSEEEFVRRADALRDATDELATMSALAGYWAPQSTARLWSHALASSSARATAEAAFRYGST